MPYSSLLSHDARFGLGVEELLRASLIFTSLLEGNPGAFMPVEQLAEIAIIADLSGQIMSLFRPALAALAAKTQTPKVRVPAPAAPPGQSPTPPIVPAPVTAATRHVVPNRYLCAMDSEIDPQVLPIPGVKDALFPILPWNCEQPFAPFVASSTEPTAVFTAAGPESRPSLH